jgi:hypothetical protein
MRVPCETSPAYASFLEILRFTLTVFFFHLWLSQISVKKERTDPPRFQFGEYVRVRTTIMGRRSLQVGRVVSAQFSSMARTLDKYVVRFDDESEEIFWDIQLESVASSSEAASSGPQSN